MSKLMMKPTAWMSAFMKAREIMLKERQEERDAKERKLIAKAFNDRYTYLHRYKVNADKYEDIADRLPGTGVCGVTARRGNAWMCPDCNTVHMAFECSVFDGIHFPACCRYPEGNRLDYGIKGGLE